MNIFGPAIFTQERQQEEEKRGFVYAWAEYYLQPNKVGRHCAWADHICKQLFVGHMMSSRPKKRKKNLQRMDIKNYQIWKAFVKI